MFQAKDFTQVAAPAAAKFYVQTEGQAYRIADTAEIMSYARDVIARQLSQGDVLSSPNLVRDYLKLWFQGRPYESFVVTFLNNQNQVLAIEEMFRGTLDQTAVYPREIIRRTLELNSGALVFAHNHPSGNNQPSHADRLLTDRLKAIVQIIDVRVLDHLIVTGERVLSFAEEGLL